MLTVAITGTEGVTALFSGDPKACLTVLVAIDTAASKLHVRMAAMRKVSKAEAHIRVRYETEIAEARVFGI
jgi:head-tail adaptor